MRTRTIIPALAAAAALTVGAAVPAGAGIAAVLELDPNPAHVGETVTINPLVGCANYEIDTPEVHIEVTGPEDQSFSVTPVLDDYGMRYDWTAQFTAGPAGVYTVNAICTYNASSTDTMARQQLPTFEYAPATLQVIAPEEPTTTSTTEAPTTSTTAAAATPTTTPAPPATAVAASPRYTG